MGIVSSELPLVHVDGYLRLDCRRFSSHSNLISRHQKARPAISGAVCQKISQVSAEGTGN